MRLEEREQVGPVSIHTRFRTVRKVGRVRVSRKFDVQF